MSDVETTDKQRDDLGQMLVIEIVSIIEKEKGMKKWKYKVRNNNNDFLMQTNIEPRDLPVTFKVGKKYLLPILMNKSGKVGNLNGQYMEEMMPWDEEGVNVSTIPLEEQGGDLVQMAKITKNDMAYHEQAQQLKEEAKTKKEIRKLFLAEDIPLVPAANDKPLITDIDNQRMASVTGLSDKGSQLVGLDQHHTDQDEFKYQDHKDEQQILDEIKGRMIDEYVYQFEVDIKKNGIVVGKRTVTGVSYAGIKALVTGRGGYSIITNTIVEVNGIWYAKVIIHDNIKDLDGLGMGECPLQESFARQKAMGKALRNAYRSAIDEGRFKAFCLQWLKENKK